MTGQDYVKHRELHPFWDESREPNKEDVIDAFEQGKAEGQKELLLNQWNETDIKQWYVANVDKSEPIWTDGHIEELCKDFIFIKKGEKV